MKPGKRVRAPLVAKGGGASSAPAVAPPTALGGRYHASNPSRITLTEYEERMDVGDLSSVDEEAKNTAGNVPRIWYEEEAHIGYDLSGTRIKKVAGKDGIDRFLSSQDDPHHRWTIYDEENDEEVVLSKRDVTLLRRIRDSGYAHPEFEAYPEFLDTWGKVEVHPLHNAPEPKRRFLPSKWEGARVARIAKAIRAGTYTFQAAPRAAAAGAAPLYLLWGEDGMAFGGETERYSLPPLPAPRPPLPGHAASYNPPPEYLLTPEEAGAWEALPPASRPTPFLPARYPSLRSVPLYAPGVKEVFERCLDLYLCPRAPGKRTLADPESLLPQLPDPSQLRPFPCALGHAFATPPAGGAGAPRCLSLDPSGAWAVSGSQDGTVALWDVGTGRRVRAWAMGGPVAAVAWGPRKGVHIVAVAVGDRVNFLYTGTAVSQEAAQATYDFLTVAAEAAAGEEGEGGKKKGKGDSDEEEEEEEEGGEEEGKEEGKEGEEGEDAAEREEIKLFSSRWSPLALGLTSPSDLLPPKPGSIRPPPPPPPPQQQRGKQQSAAAAAAAAAASTAAAAASFHTGGVVLHVSHAAPVRSLRWHSKGEYLAASTPSAPTGQVMVHAVPRRASVCPFAKNLGQVQDVAWHPRGAPLLYVANQRSIRVYNVVEGVLSSRLEVGSGGVQWISSIDVHPGGDHVLAGSYDGKTVWFDTELGSTPYKVLHSHAGGVRSAVFHPGGYPLMATASDDGTVHVFHAKVAPGGDFSQNPVIVPVKILRGHSVAGGGLGVLSLAWHPTLPWLISTGADGQVLLWRD